MKLSEFKQIQFNFKYETKIINLLDELILCFEERDSILEDLSFYFIFEIFQENTIEETQQSIQKLFDDFLRVTLFARNLISELEQTIDTNIQLKDEKKMSDKIQKVVDSAIKSKSTYNSLKEYLPENIIKQNDSMTKNLSIISKRIDEYNKKFSANLITIPQARQDYFRRYNEAADQLMEDIKKYNQ